MDHIPYESPLAEAPASLAGYRGVIVAVLALAALALALLASRSASEPERLAEAASSPARCIVAQHDLHNLELGGRVYAVDEDGIRIELAQEDRPVAIELAKARIARLCR